MSETENSAKETVQRSNVVALPGEFGYRLVGNAVVLALIFLLGFVTLLLNSDIVARQISEWKEEWFAYTADAGFTLDDIVITGRDKTSRREIAEALNLQRGDNFLKINIYEIKKKTESLPWVRKAVIRRSFFPNVLQIDIEEKQVRALWQIKERFHPVDFDGNVIDAPYKPSKPILLIVGEGAPQHINALLKIVNSDEALAKRIKVANFISQRRWNLIFDDIKNGITVKLPERSVDEAWKKLVKLEKTKGILKRKLTIIDLRLKNKVIFELKRSDKSKSVKLKNIKETKG